MTDLELYHKLRNNGFTEEGASKCIEIKNNFPTLYKHYNEYMGNFGFTDYDLLDKVTMLEIKKYMKKYPDYVLLYQPCEDLEWWLTNEY